MGNTGRKNEPPRKAGESARVKVQDKAKRPPAPKSDDEDYEDGDIATPKRDRYGNDDEPL